jgi:methyl-accepting chemotaxis protein
MKGRTMKKQHRPGLARLVAGAELRSRPSSARARSSRPAAGRGRAGRLAARLAEVESELKVRTDIMNVTSIVSEADKKGDILSINEKFIEVSKYSRDELIGKPHNTTRHPDMPKEVFKQMWSTIGRGEIFRGVIKNRAKDGTPYYVDAVIAPILGENGKPMKYLGVRYDITEAEIERQNARGILGHRPVLRLHRVRPRWQCAHGQRATSCRCWATARRGGRQAPPHVRRHRRCRSPAYTQFWRDLNAGKPQNDLFKRITKTGKESGSRPCTRR